MAIVTSCGAARQNVRAHPTAPLFVPLSLPHSFNRKASSLPPPLLSSLILFCFTICCLCPSFRFITGLLGPGAQVWTWLKPSCRLEINFSQWQRWLQRNIDWLKLSSDFGPWVLGPLAPPLPLAVTSSQRATGEYATQPHNRQESQESPKSLNNNKNSTCPKNSKTPKQTNKHTHQASASEESQRIFP